MYHRYTLILLIFYLAACGHKKKEYTETPKASPVVEKDSLTYQQFISKIDSTRKYFKSRPTDSIILQAKEYWVQLIGSEFYNYWQGTPWDFNGTTTEPKNGTIACGFFVTTVLKDAGVPINRHKLAICPSLKMMQALTSPKEIKNLSSLSYSRFSDWLMQFGKSVFVIGLDYHTGFIVNDGQEVWFIHSNYIDKVGLVKEKVSRSEALQASKTRYITCLTNSEKFLRSWLFH